MWIPNLIRYSLARAEYDSLGTAHNPYIREDWEFSMLPARLTLAHMLVTAILVACLVMVGNPVLLAIGAVAEWAVMMAAFAVLPERYFYQSKIRPIVSVRALAMMRVTFLSLMFSALAWGTYATGDWWAAYYFWLWIVPLGTSFPLYMVLRQIVQHGNGDRGWLTNSRVFLCHPLINFAVFPMGQDYHLPHHMFSTIPHYRLKALHNALLQHPEYRDGATVVEGYFWSNARPRVNPTVVDVLGPDYAPQQFNEVYIDNEVLEDRNVSDREKRELLDEGVREAERIRHDAHVGSRPLGPAMKHRRVS
jgi:hypothetical protein